MCLTKQHTTDYSTYSVLYVWPVGYVSWGARETIRPLRLCPSWWSTPCQSLSPSTSLKTLTEQCQSYRQMGLFTQALACAASLWIIFCELTFIAEYSMRLFGSSRLWVTTASSDLFIFIINGRWPWFQKCALKTLYLWQPTKREKSEVSHLKRATLSTSTLLACIIIVNDKPLLWRSRLTRCPMVARYWKDPTEFQPDRFLGQWNRDAFLPFSAGKHFLYVTSCFSF
jgi:hypothetical protein